MSGSGREPLAQRVFDEIEDGIIQRVYPPGSHLAEDEIASSLGVSRTPVREAFRMLSRAGWLAVRPHSGAYVRSPTLDEVRHVFEVRQTLEDLASRLAAARITDPKVKALRKIIDAGSREVQRGNPKQITKWNRAFHAGVAEASQNPILGGMLDDLAKQVQWHFAAVATVRGVNSWHEHGAILEAIRAGDAAGAGELAVAHARATRDAYFNRFLDEEDATARVRSLT